MRKQEKGNREQAGGANPAIGGVRAARSRTPGVRFWLFAAGCLLAWPCRADDFGDISGSADSMYSGYTLHGYAETRVTLENRSREHPHRVTLIYPNRVMGNYGHSIRSLTRTVTLAPGARVVIPLLQPPLPANGDAMIHLEVDSRGVGEIRAPNGNNHCNQYSRDGRAATVFISRALEFDAVGRVLNASRGAFTAAMATGPPDASGGGRQSNTWMPDGSRRGGTNWLELDYATPQAVDTIIVYSVQQQPSAGFIALSGVSRTNIARIPMSLGRGSASGSGWTTTYPGPANSAAVKTVRLDFGGGHAAIAIDAVAVSGPGGSQWAAAARASSDNSAAAGAFTPTGRTANFIAGLRAEAPASEWSAGWLAYTPFDAIALRGGDVSSLPPAAAASLWDYTRAGGNLLVFGDPGLPKTWRYEKQQSLPGGSEYEAGFGRCYVFASENPSELDPRTAQTLRSLVIGAAHSWQIPPDDAATASLGLPGSKNLNIPTRGIVSVMLLFVVAIGPVNLIVLSRLKRRAWMLWTIPAISGATTLLVFVYSLLREGVAPTARVAGLTLLDQAGHHAETIGAEGFYCPLTPSGGLQFDPATEATPLLHPGDGSGTAREVDWSQSQRLGRGWVSARVPAFFLVRKSEPRRERLQIERENGRLRIVNGLGAPIKSLRLADASMNIFEAEDAPAGGKTGLTPSQGSDAVAKAGAGALLRDLGFTASPALLSGVWGKYLRPNTYIAVLDGNPFLENALGSAASPKLTQSSAVVFGILEPDAIP